MYEITVNLSGAKIKKYWCDKISSMAIDDMAFYVARASFY